MQQTVYVDLLFLINFSMDYLCLYITARIMHKRMRALRMILASALGGAYSVISVFFSVGVALSLLIDALACLLICAIVFADKGGSISSTLLCSFLFVGISMMTGGAMTAIFNLLNRIDLPLDSIASDSVSTYAFAIIAAVAGFISLKSGQIVSRRSSIEECEITVRLGKSVCTARALVDSGNLVKDPISGRTVVIIDKKKLSENTDISCFERFVCGEQTKSRYPMRLIPINTAGGRSMLAAIRPDSLIIKHTTRSGKTRSIETDALLAPSDIQKSADGYSAIAPAEIIKR